MLRDTSSALVAEGSQSSIDTLSTIAPHPIRQSAQNQCDAPLSGGALADVIEHITALHREREDWLRARNRLGLQCQAICRRMCHGDKTEAQKLWAAVQKADGTHAERLRFANTYSEMLEAWHILGIQERRARSALEKAAADLPYTDWVASQRGLGLVSYAQIIAEAGDIRNYATVSKLRRRMGLAVEKDGQRQRSIAGISEEEAKAIAYSPRRRAFTFVISENMVKLGHPYKATIYAHEKQKYIDAGKRPIHAHKHGMRVMVKRLIADLWEVWHGKRVPA